MFELGIKGGITCASVDYFRRVMVTSSTVCVEKFERKVGLRVVWKDKTVFVYSSLIYGRLNPVLVTTKDDENFKEQGKYCKERML